MVTVLQDCELVVVSRGVLQDGRPFRVRHIYAAVLSIHSEQSGVIRQRELDGLLRDAQDRVQIYSRRCR